MVLKVSYENIPITKILEAISTGENFMQILNLYVLISGKMLKCYSYENYTFNKIDSIIYYFFIKNDKEKRPMRILVYFDNTYVSILLCCLLVDRWISISTNEIVLINYDSLYNKSQCYVMI